MAYSDDDLDNNYENDLGPKDTDIPVWNSGAVYYDDEIVEYQGKHYLALCKTSAEVPGRSKSGIWKEVVYNKDQSLMNLPEYEGDIYDEPLVTPLRKANALKKSTQKSEKEPAKKTQVAGRKSGASEFKRNIEKAPAEKASAASNSPVNKPLLKKQTLKEREREKEAAVPNTIKPVQGKKMAPSITRKMEIAPSEQNLVNSILKEMEFKKIKGFNTDDSNICKNLILPQTKNGVKLQWDSSHLDIISAKGEVSRPTDGNDVAVNLSLTVSLNKTTATRFYTLWVKAEERVLSDKECVDLVYEELTFTYIKGNNTKESAIRQDLELLTHGLYETEIFWASKDRELLDETGHLYKNRLSKNTKLRIYAIIVKNDVERLKHFDLVLNL